MIINVGFVVVFPTGLPAPVLPPSPAHTSCPAPASTEVHLLVNSSSSSFARRVLIEPKRLDESTEARSLFLGKGKRADDGGCSSRMPSGPSLASAMRTRKGCLRTSSTISGGREAIMTQWAEKEGQRRGRTSGLEGGGRRSPELVLLLRGRGWLNRPESERKSGKMRASEQIEEEEHGIDCRWRRRREEMSSTLRILVLVRKMDKLDSP